MAIIQGLKTKFNEVYADYDRWRPTYVSQLYQDIFSYKKVGPASSVVEVGIATGQATPPFLETGCSLTAIELGDKLAAFAEQKFSRYPNFTIRNVAFEDFICPDESIDMIYSASAFHWIPEEIGYPKVYAMLKGGGVFARFANHPYKDKGKEELHIAMQEVYAKYMPLSTLGPEYDEDRCRQRADISKKYGFTDVQYRLYHRTRTFQAREYVSLLGTYSDHRALPGGIREKFFHEIEKVIDDFGGEITIYDTMDLQLARKP